MAQDHPPRFKFDPTINLGHVLTFLGFVLTILLGWSALDKRILVLEEARQTQAQIDRNQDQLSTQQLQYIRETLQEIKQTVTRLNDKVHAP